MNSTESKDAAAVPARRLTTRSVTTHDLVLASMAAAVLTIVSQISLPMPTGVPITIQVFGITLVSVILGWRIGLLGTLVYIFLGVVGLPIFANFRGGPSLLVDFTGGIHLVMAFHVHLVRTSCKNLKQTQRHSTFISVLSGRPCSQ